MKIDLFNFRILYCLLAIFFITASGSVMNIRGQTKPSEDSLKVLLNVVRNTEKAMTKGSQSILSEDFPQAKETSLEILTNLILLQEVFMPLKERIEKVLHTEQSILRKTINEAKKQTSNIDQNELILEQSDNSKKTQICIEILKQQIQTNSNPPAVSQKQKNDDVGREKQLNKFKKIKDLIQEATLSQDNAVNNLNDIKYKKAIIDEKQAIEYLEKALKLFNKTKKDQKNKNSQNKTEQKQQNKQSKSNQQQKEPNASQKKKMTPKEALKQLSKLRKEANDEKKRREKKYGKMATPQSIPVEKDW